MTEDELFPSSDWSNLSPRTILNVRSCFPKSIFDASFFLELLSAQERLKENDMTVTGSSQINRIISNALLKQAGLRAVAGVTALSYIALHLQGQRASLERASNLASEFCYLAGDGWFLSRTAEKKVKKFRMNADQSGVKRTFREYRSVCHICAAELCANSEETNESSEVSFRDSKYFSLVLLIQNLLTDAVDVSDWGLVSVTPFAGAPATRSLEAGRSPLLQLQTMSKRKFEGG